MTEKFQRQYYGVYAAEGFIEDGAIALFRYDIEARKFADGIACDCIIIATMVDGSLDNGGEMEGPKT